MKRGILRLSLACLLVASSLAAAPGRVGATGPIEPSPPGPPTLLSPADGATFTTNPVLTWTTVPGAEYYGAEVATDPGFNDVIGDSGALTVGMDNTELPAGILWWRAVSIGFDGRAGPWSAPRVLIKLPRITTAPLLLAPADGAVLAFPGSPGPLRWSAVAGAYDYEIEFALDRGFTTIIGDGPIALTGTLLQGNDLVPNQRLYWRVRARTMERIQVGPWSAARAVTVTWDSTPSLVAPADGAHVANAVLQWQPVTGTAQYYVEAADVTDPTFSHPDVLLPKTPWVACCGPAFPAGFLWRVRSETTDNLFGAWSATHSVVIDAAAPAMDPPAPPTLVAPTLIAPADGSTITGSADTPFQWQLDPATYQYEIQWGAEPDPFGALVHDTTSTIGQVIWQFPFDAGTAYAWRLRELGPAGEQGPWSVVNHFTTSPNVGPVLTGPDDGASVPMSTATLSWQPVPTTRQYFVEWSRTPDFAATRSDSSYEDPLLPVALAPGDWYWRVTAIGTQLEFHSAVRRVTVVDDDPPTVNVTLGNGFPTTTAASLPLTIECEDYLGSTPHVPRLTGRHELDDVSVSHGDRLVADGPGARWGFSRPEERHGRVPGRRR